MIIAMMGTHVPHVSDGELVRLLDEAGDRTERERVRGHVSACERCAERLETLRGRSSRLSELLPAVDEAVPELSRPPVHSDPVPSGSARPDIGGAPAGASAPSGRWFGRSSRRLLRVAAVVLLAAGVALSVDPVRAWVADRWAEVADLFEDEPPAVAEPAPVPAPPSGAVVSFVPTGEVFRLTLEHTQAEGTLVVRVADRRRASARVVGAGADEALLVLPSGLRIRNARRSTADYRITVPAALERVRVRVGGGPAVVYPIGGAGAAERITIDLSAGG